MTMCNGKGVSCSEEFCSFNKPYWPFFLPIVFVLMSFNVLNFTILCSLLTIFSSVVFLATACSSHLHQHQNGRQQLARFSGKIICLRSLGGESTEQKKKYAHFFFAKCVNRPLLHIPNTSMLRFLF